MRASGRAAAIELPFERQRRVALLATVALSAPDALSVGVIHLDALRASRRLWIFGTRAWRATRAKSLESLLPHGDLVLGADLNTWLGSREPAVQYFRQLLADPRAIAGGTTPRRRVLDYLILSRFASRHCALSTGVESIWL